MKKLFPMSILLMLLAITLGACSAPQVVEEQPVVYQQYITNGRYYIDGTVITSDENIWVYGTDYISGKVPYDNQPVYVAFDDNGTPEDIYDDIILGLVYDRETAVYDTLEQALSDKFTLTRDGNNIRILDMKDARKE